MHTRHPTEQTVTDEKLEKNYFRHRYIFTLYSLYLIFFVFLLNNIYKIHKFYILLYVITDYNVQIRKVPAVENGQQHLD